MPAGYFHLSRPAFRAGRRNLFGGHNTSGNLPPGVAGAWCCFGALLSALVLSMLQGSFAQAQQTQRGRLQIAVRPLLSPVAPMSYDRSSSFSRPSDNRRQLGTPDPQVFVVEVEISNTTQRIYVLAIDRVTLRTAEEELVKPINVEDKPVPTPALTSQTLVPGAAVKGYLYYPAGSYVGARGFLTEEQGPAREGFSIRF